MTSNGSCLYTPPLSPVSIETNETRPQTRVVRRGCGYPSYKRRQPQNLKIQTDVSEYHKKASAVYPMINQTSVAEKQKVKGSSGATNMTHKQYMEKVMENTNLICSFLKTICFGMPVDEESMTTDIPSPNVDETQKKKKSVSIENFVANILIRTKLGDTFVYVALFYIQKYLSMKVKSEESKKMKAYHFANQSTNEVVYVKKNVYLPKNLAVKMSNTKRHHSILKNDTKIKVSQQSLNYLLQQSKKTKKEEVKKNNSNIVEHVGLPKETLIRTQKDLIFAAMICSSKYLDDNSYCNSAWVKLTDKSLKEVFALEREFLMSLQYKLYFTNEEWKEWFVWVSHFKVLLDSGMTCVNDEKSMKSPSCMVSIPSQSSIIGQPINYRCTVDNGLLPSPVDIPTPTSATFLFDKEEMKEEMNYPGSNNNFMPSLSSIASFAGRLPPQVPSIAIQQYLMGYNRSYCTADLEQYPVYHCPSYSGCYENYQSMEYSGMQYMKRRMAYKCMPEKLQYLPYPTYNEIRKSRSCLLNNVDTSLISQAQNTPIDFSEVQKLTQQQNITFKKPILPPCSSTPNDSFDVVNYALKLAPSKNTSSHSASGLFIPPLY